MSCHLAISANGLLDNQDLFGVRSVNKCGFLGFFLVISVGFFVHFELKSIKTSVPMLKEVSFLIC